MNPAIPPTPWMVMYRQSWSVGGTSSSVCFSIRSMSGCMRRIMLSETSLSNRLVTLEPIHKPVTLVCHPARQSTLPGSQIWLLPSWLFQQLQRPHCVSQYLTPWPAYVCRPQEHACQILRSCRGGTCHEMPSQDRASENVWPIWHSRRSHA